MKKNIKNNSVTLKTRIGLAALAGTMMLTFAAPAAAFAGTPSTNMTAQSSSTLEKIRDKIVDLDNAALDDLADNLPCGNIITQPLRWLTDWISGAGGEEKDPIEELSENVDRQLLEVSTRIDQIDGKVDELSAQLTDATARITNSIMDASKRNDMNATWINVMNDNSQRLSECRTTLNDLNNNAFGTNGLYFRMAARESSATRSAYQKLIDIAAMSTEPQMVKITNDLDTLAAMMSSRKGALNSNFFDAVMVYNYQNVMFSREAYELSKETADAIVSQYIAAALVYLRSLEAEKAIGEYDETVLAEVGPEYAALRAKIVSENADLLRRYNKVVDNINKVVNGYLDYVWKNKTSNRFVNHGKVNYTLTAQAERISFQAVTGGTGLCGGQSSINGKAVTVGEYEKQVQDLYTGRKLSVYEMAELVDYVKAYYPGKSLVDFLREMDVRGELNSRGMYIPLTNGITQEKLTGEANIRYGVPTDYSVVVTKCRAVDTADRGFAKEDKILSVYAAAKLNNRYYNETTQSYWYEPSNAMSVLSGTHTFLVLSYQ